VDLERASIDELNLSEEMRTERRQAARHSARTQCWQTGRVKPQALKPATCSCPCSHLLMSNLDEFITHKLPLPEPLATSAEIQDRQSTFLAYIFKASTPKQARDAHSHVRRVIHAKRPATHEIMAWRCMVLKDGRTGLRGDDDFKVEEGSEDDGEQWAGGHVLKVMRSEAIMDAVVIVSRW